MVTVTMVMVMQMVIQETVMLLMMAIQSKENSTHLGAFRSDKANDFMAKDNRILGTTPIRHTMV